MTGEIVAARADGSASSTVQPPARPRRFGGSTQETSAVTTNTTGLSRTRSRRSPVAGSADPAAAGSGEADGEDRQNRGPYQSADHETTPRPVVSVEVEVAPDRRVGIEPPQLFNGRPKSDSGVVESPDSAEELEIEGAGHIVLHRRDGPDHRPHSSGHQGSQETVVSVIDVVVAHTDSRTNAEAHQFRGDSGRGEIVNGDVPVAQPKTGGRRHAVEDHGMTRQVNDVERRQHGEEVIHESRSP